VTLKTFELTTERAGVTTMIFPVVAPVKKTIDYRAPGR
jgi:hypothetical protein